MKKSILLMTLSLSMTNVFAQSWEIVGNQSYGQGYYDLQELEMINDVPHVIYTDYNTGDLKLTKFENNTWSVPLNGTISTSNSGIYRTTSDSNGAIYVAYADGSANWDLSVKKWNGTSWEYIGTPGFGADTRSGYPMQISCLSDNSLVLAHSAAHSWGAGELEVFHFNGAIWETIGSNLIADTVGYISMGILSNDNIYINYRTDNDESRVIKYDGTDWNILTTPFDGYSTYRSFMQVGSNDEIIGWRTDYGQEDYYFYKASNDVWTAIPNPSDLTTTFPLEYNWAVEYNAVDASWYVGYTPHMNYGNYLKKFDGTAWNQVGDEIVYSIGGFRYSDLEFNSLGVPFYTSYAYNLMTLSETAGLKNNNLLADFSIYPNPSSSQITLSFNTQEARFSLFDMNGKELLSKVVANQESIDVSSFEKGMYIVKIDGIAERLVID